jgi:hypothetical protein
MNALYGLLFLLGSVAAFAFIGERVNRLVYGSTDTTRRHANILAAVVGATTCLFWLAGWAAALVVLPVQVGRWVWLGISVLSCSILNGLRSDFTSEREDMQQWLKHHFGDDAS